MRRRLDESPTESARGPIYDHATYCANEPESGETKEAVRESTNYRSNSLTIPRFWKRTNRRLYRRTGESPNRRIGDATIRRIDETENQWPEGTRNK